MVGQRCANARWDRFHGKELAPLPVPAVAPDGFVAMLGEGFGGSIHDLAGAMELLGTGEAARVLLGLIVFVEEGARGARGVLSRPWQRWSPSRGSSRSELARVPMERTAGRRGMTVERDEGVRWDLERRPLLMDRQGEAEIETGEAG